MPKDKRVCSLSADRSKVSPYPCGSKDTVQEKSKNMFEKDEDVKEWEETRCPICMEHPHSAVLLQCSSRDKGCRPFMCNTGSRHSNCLYEFQKSLADSSGQSQPKLTCPLCRGQVNGWIVVESARQFMNSKSRSCPAEACEFVGTYLELRNHIRREHPHIRPSEVDPARLQEWLRLERERELKDVLCLMFSEMGESISPAIYDSLVSRFMTAMHRYH